MLLATPLGPVSSPPPKGGVSPLAADGTTAAGFAGGGAEEVGREVSLEGEELEAEFRLACYMAKKRGRKTFTPLYSEQYTSL